MVNIKLFVCCHHPVEVPEQPLLIPIQVGAALSNERFPHFLQDDSGDHISRKNRSYCELTAQYWAWKNVQADYYGFFHYRRYLYPDQKARRPYRIAQKPVPALLEKLGYGEFADLIQKYDLILPIGENMYVPVRKHYANAPFHREQDLALIERIVRERYPEMTTALNQYLSGTVSYFGNIYIMKQCVFQDYCAWLFPLLEEFDLRADRSGYSPQEQRVDGYLAERLLGIYQTYHRELRKTELPRVHFDAIDSNVDYTKRLLYFFLPPGTRRRMAVKKILMSKKDS